MDEKSLRAQLIGAKREQDIAIRDNQIVLEKLSILLEKLKTFDREQLFVMGIDVSSVLNIDSQRLVKDKNYLDSVKLEISSIVNKILLIVEKELAT